MNQVTMEKIVNMAKTQGFVYQGSEIYGGLANTWDYGPLGVEELKKYNVKKAWWKKVHPRISINVGCFNQCNFNEHSNMGSIRTRWRI